VSSQISPYQRLNQLPRGGVRIDVVKHLRLSFETDEDSPDPRLVAVLRCATCDDGLMWQGGWWTCPSCGIELLSFEVMDFLEVARRSLKELNSDVGTRSGRGRWDWLVRFFRRTPKAR
jgi:hypothetical protein